MSQTSWGNEKCLEIISCLTLGGEGQEWQMGHCSLGFRCEFAHEWEQVGSQHSKQDGKHGEWRLCRFSPTECLSTLLCFSCAWGKPASSVRGQHELVRKSCYRKTLSWAMTWKLRLWVSEQALARDLSLVSKPPWGKGDCFCYVKCAYEAALAFLLHPDV